MKIISLNVNRFGGDGESFEAVKKHHTFYHDYRDYREALSDWDSRPKTQSIQGIIEIVKNQIPDILVLQEYDFKSTDSRGSNGFEDKMTKLGYHVTPREFDGERPSVTVMFVKNDLISREGNNPHQAKGSPTDRAHVIEIDDIVIYGTHVPFSSENNPQKAENYWDELLDFYDRNKGRKVILIGDFNTYDEDKSIRKYYHNLLAANASDVWLKLGNPNWTPTEKKHKGRLDYAFASPAMIEHISSMQIYPQNEEFDDWTLSDHAALILSID